MKNEEKERKREKKNKKIKKREKEREREERVKGGKNESKPVLRSLWTIWGEDM